MDRVIDDGLRSKAVHRKPLAVVVAYRQKMISKEELIGMKWVMQGYVFCCNLCVLELWGCVIVLRVDLMRQKYHGKHCYSYLSS